MNFEKKLLKPGLYFLATPIGTARDITLRALDILASADVIVAEDTRSCRRLMEIHGIAIGERPLMAYHDHSGAATRDRLMGMIADGKSVAYASEAGTPLVADPGYALATDAIAAEHLVTSAPGPSAIIAALTIAGLPTDRFHFAGFSPNTKTQRQKFLRDLAAVQATVVLYESPKRLLATLADLAEIMGSTRQAAVARELTKKFEEVQRGTFVELQDEFADRSIKGEIVILIDRAETREATPEVIDEMLREALKSHRVKDAAKLVAEALDVPRRDVYQAALALANK